VNSIKAFFNRNQKLKILTKKILGIYRVESIIKYFEEKFIYGYVRDLSDRISLLEQKFEEKNQLAFLKFEEHKKSTLFHPESQPATNSQFLEPIYSEWCNKIKSEKKFHRKQWEYVYILRGLEVSGMIENGKRGVGFGVGFEPIAPYLATQGVFTVSTDLALQEAHRKGWVDTNQYTKKIEDLELHGLAKISILKEFITFRNVDMNNIDPDLTQEEFDFTWSACAFEHLGSIDKGLTFVLNSLKCLKPGGVALHTTELNVSSNEETLDSGDTVIFRKKDFEYLARELKKEGHEIHLNFDLGDSRIDDFYDIPPYSEFNHIKLKLDKYITTSFGLMIKKKS
jgi:hypothetical protein